MVNQDTELARYGSAMPRTENKSPICLVYLFTPPSINHPCLVFRQALRFCGFNGCSGIVAQLSAMTNGDEGL